MILIDFGLSFWIWYHTYNIGINQWLHQLMWVWSIGEKFCWWIWKMTFGNLGTRFESASQTISFFLLFSINFCWPRLTSINSSNFPDNKLIFYLFLGTLIWHFVQKIKGVWTWFQNFQRLFFKSFGEASNPHQSMQSLIDALW